MQLTKWEPFGEMRRFQRDMNRLLEDFPRLRMGNGDLSAWAPEVDVFEEGDNLVLKMDVPGMDPKAIDVQVENNTLTLRGERKTEREEQKRNYYFSERSYGAFARSFTLPSSTDANKIKADCKDGVLQITMPKAEDSKAKRINIST